MQIVLRTGPSKSKSAPSDDDEDNVDSEDDDDDDDDDDDEESGKKQKKKDFDIFAPGTRVYLFFQIITITHTLRKEFVRNVWKCLNVFSKEVFCDLHILKV